MSDNLVSNNDLPNFDVDVASLPKSGLTIKLQAKPAELEKIAVHMGAVSVEKFTCLITFSRWVKDGVLVTGEFDVAAHTPSPVSLAPVPQAVDTQFSAKYVPITSKLAKSQFNENGEIVINIEDEDTPDIFEGDKLDAWAIAIEYALLEIDPFARLDGEEFEQKQSQENENLPEESPFSVLNKLKN